MSFPTALVKSNFRVISPLIKKVNNHSLQAGHVPSTVKTAVIRPLLIKPTLDSEVLAIYRPISNLTLLYKVLEKVDAAQFQVYLKQNNLFGKFLSGFHPSHSMKTALVRVTNDLRMTASVGSQSLLILLDLTAVFDTVDPNILLHRLHYTIGLSDSVYNWFSSYLTRRTEHVTLGEAKSLTCNVTCGVPQGSVLGPNLFILYMLPPQPNTQLYLRTNSIPSAALPSSRR